MHDGITRKQAKVLVVLCVALASLNFVSSVCCLFAYAKAKEYNAAVARAAAMAERLIQEARALKDEP